MCVTEVMQKKGPRECREGNRVADRLKMPIGRDNREEVDGMCRPKANGNVLRKHLRRVKWCTGKRRDLFLQVLIPKQYHVKCRFKNAKKIQIPEDLKFIVLVQIEKD